MRGLTLTLGLSALMSVGVVLGSVALNDAWTDADDNTPMVDTQIPSVETPIGVSDADDSAGLLRWWTRRSRRWRRRSSPRSRLGGSPGR